MSGKKEKKRTRHTAIFQLSKFLNSNESFEYPLTGSMVAILRYMYEVMEITHSRTGVCICKKSNTIIAQYSRTSQNTVRRALPFLIDYKLLKVEKKIDRSIAHYEIGETISSALTESPDYPQAENNEKIWAHSEPSSGLIVSPENSIWAHSELTYKKKLLEIKKEQRERGSLKTSSLTLSIDFYPNQETIQFATELGFGEEILKEFRDFCSDRNEKSYDWDARFRKYLRQELKYAQKYNGKTPKTTKPVIIVNPTVAHKDAVIPSKPLHQTKEIRKENLNHISKILKHGAQNYGRIEMEKDTTSEEK